MPATAYPFQMIGGVPVVTAPAEIDVTTSGELRTILFERQSRGHTTLVVDMTGTVFCDSAGLSELVRAHKRAVADGGGLRLVTPVDGALPRIFAITGLDGIIPCYATLKKALAQVPSGAIRRPGQGLTGQAAAVPASLSARVRERDGLVAESRSCEQCGAAFVPIREHARFCTSGCRLAWNHDHLGDPAVEASALTWSMVAMSEATARLPAVKVWDQPQAFAVIGEAVWWITMVDATLVRHHTRAYDTVMAAHTQAERRLIDETLGGLRFVRNWISRTAGLGDIVETGADTGRITHWTWRPVPDPALAWLPPRAQAWEQTRYRAYQARLAGHPIGKTFIQAVTFLTLTGADAASSTDTSQHDRGGWRKGLDQAGAYPPGSPGRDLRP